MIYLNRCTASERDYSSFAQRRPDLPAPSISGKTTCPKCGKPIKLRTGKLGAHHLNTIPTHNTPRKEA